MAAARQVAGVKVSSANRVGISWEYLRVVALTRPSPPGEGGQSPLLWERVRRSKRLCGLTEPAGESLLDFDDEEHHARYRKRYEPVAQRQRFRPEQHLHKRQVDNGRLKQEQHAGNQPDPFVCQQATVQENPSVLRQLIMYTHWAQTSICSSTVRMNSAL